MQISRGSVSASATALGVFLVALITIPLVHMRFLEMVPGDVGDARLVNYFLENIFQFIHGRSASLWHLGFFAPFPYVLGYSENLLGCSPIYLLARALTAPPDTAFQIWFLVGYAVNFASAYYVLRRFGTSLPAACMGALIFAFALPTSAHAGHAQLHYRFGIPLSVLYFALFLETRQLRYLAVSTLWLSWQFCCSIYMGFFAFLLLVGMIICHIVFDVLADRSSFRRILESILLDWSRTSSRTKVFIIVVVALSFLAMLLLFYPYLQVARLYSIKRHWGEIEIMLPRAWSYMMADASWIWGGLSRRLPSVPMRHEHQMFAGLVPSLLALAGLLLLFTGPRRPAMGLVAGGAVLTMVATLYVAGRSLWYPIHVLPLASAIRAMTRIDQMLLFPVAVLAALAVDRLREIIPKAATLVVGGLIVLTIAESTTTSFPHSPKAEWRARFAAADAIAPKELPPSAILFFAQKTREPIFYDIDAMWVSLMRGAPTMNGYSGFFPSGYSFYYGSNCSEMVRRVKSYLLFVRRFEDISAYRALMARIVPVGFSDCDASWLDHPPPFSIATRKYTPDQFRQLSYRFGNLARTDDGVTVSIIVANAGDEPISALSAVGTPVRAGWRFLHADGSPASGWDTTRLELPFDIPAKGELTLKIPVNPAQEVKGGTLQVSLVQENRFWGHDVGLAPLSIKWD